MASGCVTSTISTKEQGRSGLGLEAQDRDIALFLENFTAKPYRVVQTFTDVLSGADNDTRTHLAHSFSYKDSTVL